jgi:hypothetical protein
MTETLTISGRGVEREQTKTTQQPESLLPLLREAEERAGERRHFLILSLNKSFTLRL